MAQLPRKLTFAAAAGLLTIVAAITASLDQHEGRVYTTYWDKLGQVWTVCRGVTGPGVVPGKTYTSAECDGLEQHYVADMLGAMGHCVTAELEFHEIKAWGHFAYNVGTEAFCNSTAASLLNGGKNAEACAQISRWIMVKGRDCRIRANDCYGIVLRREWERSVCEGRT